MPTYNFVIVTLKPAKGATEPRAQIVLANTAGAARPLSDFPQAFIDLLGSTPIASRAPCKPTHKASPEPPDLEPTGEVIPPGVAIGQAQPANRMAPHHRAGSPPFRGMGGHGAGPAQRPGHAPAGPQQPSKFDNNPYNFAEWDGGTPWGVDANGHPGATHEAWRNGRLSGVLAVELTARTPVFVPEGSLDRSDPPAPRGFWKCRRADGAEKFGIPGSSIKGVVRSLYEAWTNSRLGFISEDNYAAIPYRRRSSTAWVVIGDHHLRGGLELTRCDLELVKKTGATWTRRVMVGETVEMHSWSPASGPVPVTGPRISTLPAAGWQAVPFRANLLWSANHTHRYTHLALQVTTYTARLSPELRLRFEQGLTHRAYQNHPEMVNKAVKGGLIKDPYSIRPTQPTVDTCLTEMKDLSPGTVVFGLEQGGELKSIGRNVNYLWPSAKSPGDLLHGFRPRQVADQHLNGADLAEATFGFAGSHSAMSHPFRGRVRFSTFWAAGTTTELPSVTLSPLTSPTGLKLKARPLYLPPGAQGQTQTYDEASRMRGRKFYWHQQWGSGSVAPSHLADRWMAQHPDFDRAKLPVIRPLPQNTDFIGEVHFDNLLPEELGALIVSLAPALYFEKRSGYGIKLGKAKPRGFGSVEATRLTLRLREQDPVAAYRTMDREEGWSAGERDTFVTTFRNWVTNQAGGTKPEFVSDLEKLLRLPAPGAEVPKDYHGTPGDYGWLPKFNNVNGEPGGGNGRPRPMRRARDL